MTANGMQTKSKLRIADIWLLYTAKPLDVYKRKNHQTNEWDLDFNKGFYFYVQRRSLQAIGLQFSPRFRMSFWFPINFFLFVMTALSLLHYAFVQRNNLKKIIESMAPFVVSCRTSLKTVVFLYHKQAFCGLFDRLLSKGQRRTADEFEILMKRNRDAFRVNFFYYITAFATGCTSLISPLIIMALNYQQTGETIAMMPFERSFFIDITKPWNYAAVYLWSMSFVSYAVFGSVAFDSLSYWLAQNIAAEFEMLQQKLKQINSNETLTLNHTSMYDDALRLWIKQHQKTISNAKQFDTLLRPVALFDVILSSLQFCFIIYQVTGRTVETAQIPYVVSFFSAACALSIIFCHGAQRLQDESSSIAEAIFKETHWHSGNVKAHKLLHFIMLRSQKPCRLSGIFFEMRLSLCLNILKTAFSYIALLENLKDREEN